MVEHQFPYKVAKALAALNTSGLLVDDLAQANRDAVVAHQDPQIVVSALDILNTAGLLTSDVAQANFNASTPR